MPTVELKTNVKLDNPKAFIKEFSHFSAELLKKPISYICTSYTYNENLAWAGTFDPAFILNIVSLGNISPEQNEAYSKAIYKFFEEKLGVQGDRGYVTFIDPGNSNIGYKSTHFGTIFGTN